MRAPGRLHITWQDDATLKIETEAGTQTRLLRFGPAQAATLRVQLLIPPGKGPFPVFLTNHPRTRPWSAASRMSNREYAE